MRKLLLVLTMLCLPILVFSQAKKYVYAKAEYNSKRYCIIHCNYDDGKGTPIMNEKGDILKFRTDIEFINYLANEGWEFVLTQFTHESQSIHYFVVLTNLYIANVLGSICVSKALPIADTSVCTGTIA